MYATLLCEAELSQEDASGEGWGAFCGGVVFLHSSFVGGSDGWMVHGWLSWIIQGTSLSAREF